MSFDPTDRDRAIYAEELRDFLPPRVFDVHVHLLDRTCLAPDFTFGPRNPFRKFGGQFTIEQCFTAFRALLPEQEIHLNSFGHPSTDADRDTSGAYTGRISDNRRLFGMALVSPEDSVESIRRRVVANRLVGYKPYPAFVRGKPAGEVTIRDMLPDDQMQLADEMHLAVMLHLPREDRLADPINQAQMVELCRRYPHASIIFAHIGRAYYLRGLVGQLDGIAECPNAYLDTAMVNHEGVLEYALRHFPASGFSSAPTPRSPSCGARALRSTTNTPI